MFRILKFTLFLALMIPFLAACGGNRNSTQAEFDDSPIVRFVSPKDGATVSSPVTVRMNAINYTIEEAGEVRENSGHFHIMVNQDCVQEGEIIPGTEGYNHYGKAQLETELELEPGEHKLCLQVGDGLHAATTLIQEITITVE